MWTTVIMFVAIIAIFYFLIIRPTKSAVSTVVNKDAAKANPNKKKEEKAEAKEGAKAEVKEEAKTAEPDNSVEFKAPENKEDK